METKPKPRNQFLKIRVNSDDVELRKMVTDFHGKSMSEVDRILWEEEAEEVKKLIEIKEKIEDARKTIGVEK
jgi:hypothetical protein